MDVSYATERRSIIPLTVLMLLICQWNAAQVPAISNVQFEAQDSIILVHFDVLLEEKKKSTAEEHALDNEYLVELLLRKESDPAFMYRPEKISGDIGSISMTGKNKTIVWNILEELPGGVDDTDFYFEIRLLPVDPDPQTVYLWLSAGAVLAATSIVTYFIVSDERSKDSSPGKFPLPPGRPK